MQQILLAVQVLVAVAVIVMVLLQQGRGADAGASFGGGSSGSLFGSRGPASFLAKITGVLAALFFVNSLALAYLAADSGRERSVVERVQPAADTAVPETPASLGSDVPTAPTGSGDVPGAPVSGTGDVPSAPAGAPASGGSQ
jgi:preprotein translocase subunit SecG